MLRPHEITNGVNTICDGDLFINIDSVCPFQRLRSRWGPFSSDSCYRDDICITFYKADEFVRFTD